MESDLEREAVSAQATERLVRASFIVIALVSQVAAVHDLSLTQLRVLGILRDREPTMAQLADRLGLERSSMSGMIDRSVSRGLVQRSTSADDKRSVQVHLTTQGRRLARQLMDEVHAAISPLTGQLNAVDQSQLTGLLAKMGD
jgi:MarR family transcriptional regulator, lower aerobic nicotinate degradation pathway regulator